MFPTQLTQLANLTALAAGQRSAALMKNAVRTLRNRVTVTGDVVVSVVGTGILNRGSILAGFDKYGIAENGVDRWNADPRVLAHVSRARSAGRDSSVRLTTAQATALGTYSLRETFDVAFALPNVASPTETAFVEQDTRQALESFVLANLTGAKLVKGGTAVLQNVKVLVQQIYDDKTGPQDRPLFVPVVREIVRTVSAQNDAEQIFIRSSRYMVGICISQDSDVGEVSDIITSLAIRGDHRDIIGPAQADWGQLITGQTQEAGGDVDSQSAHVYLPWYRNGRLSTVFNPAADRNLRIEAKVAPSVTPGATNSKIRVTVFELERITGVTADALPFAA
jgi:hypothetical protein